MGFPAESFLWNVNRLVWKTFYYSCNDLTHEETNVLWHYIAKLKSSLLDVFIGSFVRKPNFLPEEFFPGLQVPIEVM